MTFNTEQHYIHKCYTENKKEKLKKYKINGSLCHTTSS